MTWFLDHQLRVQWFTPAVNALFPLMPGDVGRRITDLSPRFRDPHFISDVLDVIRADTLSESEVRSIEGLWYSRRILPLRGGDTRKGVAVTFSDITARKSAQDALRESQAQLTADLAGMRRLYEVHSKLANETNLDAALGEILAAAVAFTGTDRGTIQLVGNDGERMYIIAHRGIGHRTIFHEPLRAGPCWRRSPLFLRSTPGHRGVFAVPSSRIDDYIKAYNPVILRWDRRAKPELCEGPQGVQFRRVQGIEL
jgi:hypothetical protein